MRKQRYQRHIAKSKDPARVNTDTSDQDRQLLQTQLKGLKMIWADEDEPDPIKRGDHYNAIDQDIKDGSAKVQSVSATSKEANPELSESLNASISGDKVAMAGLRKAALIEKYGEDGYQNYVAYSYKNQPIVDKKANFDKYIGSIPPSQWNDKFLSERDIDPKKYLTETEITTMNVRKDTAKAKDFILSTPLTDANIDKTTTQLIERVNKANITDKTKIEFKALISGRKSAFKDAKLKQFNRESNELRSAHNAGEIHRIDNYAKLNDADAISVGGAKFTKNSQALQEGQLSFNRFKKQKAGERAQDVYTAKYNSFITKTHRSIVQMAAKTESELILNSVKTIPKNHTLAVELMYNYFNERQKDDPEFTIDEARDELYSNDNSNQTEIKQLVTDSHSDYKDIVEDDVEYVKLLSTKEGRLEFRRRAAKLGKSWATPNIKHREPNDRAYNKSEQPPVL